ncbi:MAG: hypothetical protein LBP55_10175 [Candidatus Adiutrix sp.]|nr:hypothetical protein [Candidatus Adiutrix sp.]
MSESRAKVGPTIKVVDFQPETFPVLNQTGPVPDIHEDFGRLITPKEPPPDPLEEFKDDRPPLAGFMDDLPSLEGLFKPFDLAGDSQANQAAYEDLFNPGQPSQYIYEDMDIRDPDVVRTLAQAETRRQEITNEAKARAAAIIETAVTEAKGRAAEVRAQEEAGLAKIRRETDERLAEAGAELARAASERAAAEDERQTAAGLRAEAEAELAAAAERIAGLDQERGRLEAEHAARLAEVEQDRAKTQAEAQTSGHQTGYDRGLAEGRAAGQAEALKNFQEQTAGLVAIMAKMENLYNDLWTANEPLMVKLAVEAVEHILGKELAEDKELAAAAFRSCIAFLSQAHRVTFLARPQDIAQLDQARAECREQLGALVKVTFQPDETLGPGDLIMESDIGRLDATVKHRANQVLSVLRESFRRAYPQAETEGSPTDHG